MLEKDNKIFVKEYEIPSYNYNKNGMLGLWWASGIETEIKQILNQLDNKVFFRSYRDKYFFSNSEKKAHERMLQEIEREILIEAYKKKIRLGKGAR